MITVTYHNAAGAARRTAIPTIDGVPFETIAASVIGDCLKDAGPVAQIRLLSDTAAMAASGEPEPEAPAAPEAGEDGGRKR